MLQGPQPRVLQLLVSPPRGQLVDALVQNVAAALCSRGKIEQHRISVEDASIKSALNLVINDAAFGGAQNA
jgi:hypothetical protein